MAADLGRGLELGGEQDCCILCQHRIRFDPRRQCGVQRPFSRAKWWARGLGRPSFRMSARGMIMLHPTVGLSHNPVAKLGMLFEDGRIERG